MPMGIMGIFGGISGGGAPPSPSTPWAIVGGSTLYAYRADLVTVVESNSYSQPA